MQPRADRFDRRQRLRCVGDRSDEQLLQCNGSVEQHLALVGEVPEERALGQSGAPSDLRDRGVVVPALAVQRHRCLGEPSTGVGLPTNHTPDGS